MIQNMIDEHKDDNFPEKLERPVECSECRRPISVHYSEIVNGNMTHIGMCDQCPQLQLKMFGSDGYEEVAEFTETKTGLECGECGTALEPVKMGSPLGCSVCYEVFSDIIIQQLTMNGKLPKKTKSKTTPLHIGRSPGKIHEMSPSLRIHALNEALDDTLKREDYEQAAMLRDQIKELTKESKGKESGKQK
ncbi:MAG: UvrB/UvrC motif-containing protein [Waddliaceae bacterium]